jgi:hypothetical protein
MNSELIKRIESVIEVLRNILDEDTMNEVMHYFDHGEYEMSYEGLMIDAMEVSLKNISVDFVEMKEIAIELRLDKDTVFDSEFWTKFIEWENRN